MGAITALAVGAIGAKVIGGAVAANQADKAAGRAKNAADRAQAEIDSLKASRGDVINPYEGVTDLSAMAQDLSSQMSNPFAQLGVATQAAEMQAEQADIALANTLDTLRATGASAGGATALAQAALQSKKGIAASIQSQEATNEKARAQGEANLQQQKIAEQQRVQSVAMSEGRRVQAAEAEGKAYVFANEENRINADLDRASGQLDQSRAQQASSNQAKAAAWGGAASSVGDVLGGLAGASDRRLKKNIKLIGKSSSGINIYAFEYINKMFGDGIWQGAMSDEVPSHALIKNIFEEYDGVDYSKIDVEFKQV
jgi:hypothetical protein